MWGGGEGDTIMIPMCCENIVLIEFYHSKATVHTPPVATGLRPEAIIVQKLDLTDTFNHYIS